MAGETMDTSHMSEDDRKQILKGELHALRQIQARADDPHRPLELNEEARGKLRAFMLQKEVDLGMLDDPYNAEM